MKEKIIKYIIKLIKRDEKNKKLPSENEMAMKFNCSRSTVVNAYNALKNMGLIKSRKGSGWFIDSSSKRVPIISQSEDMGGGRKIVSLIKNNSKFSNHISNINLDRTIGWDLKYMIDDKLNARVYIFIKDKLSSPDDIEKIKKYSSTLFIDENHLKIREIKHNLYFSDDKIFNSTSKQLGYVNKVLINHYTIITIDDEIILEGLSIVNQDTISVTFNKQWYK